MDFALAQLALVFMPGMIWANIDAKFGAGLKPQQTTLLIRAFIFGMATYSTLFVVYLCLGLSFGYQSLGSDTTGVNIIELKDEIAWSIPLSFVLSVIWLWVVRYRLLMKLLHKVGATRRYGDEDVWSYTLNSDQAHVEYVHLRDLENGFIFAGWVNTYSESEDYRELLLRSVIVYDEGGKEISSAPLLYLSRPKNNIWLEFPYRAEGDKNVGKESSNQ
jgi:hypothetical protein